VKTNSKKLKRTVAAGILGSLLFAGAAYGAEARMQAQPRVTSTRPAQAVRGRVVEFKPERTDSWLCEYVSPFFCSYVPTVTAVPQPSASSSRTRGR